MAEQPVILVTEDDEPIGVMEKMEAHQKGLLHRAFSVFIFDSAGRMLLQRRAQQKYHGGGLWTNACCSHPFPGEAVDQAALRRLDEELGFSCTLRPVFAFTYRAEVENRLIEHEYDHVFVGEYEGAIRPDPSEVEDHAYQEMEQIRLAMSERPDGFTSWFRIAFPRIEKWWQENYASTGSRRDAGMLSPKHEP